MSTTSRKTIRLNSIEKIPVEIETAGDPTGALPAFQLVSNDGAESSWEDGEWDGTWSTATGIINALSPLVGLAATLPILATDYWYDLNVRWTLGTEIPERNVDRYWVDPSD